MADGSIFLIQILNGVQYGLLLFLIASGLTLIFGVMGIINLAHGSLFMIGAYVAFLVARQWGSLWLAVPVADLFDFSVPIMAGFSYSAYRFAVIGLCPVLAALLFFWIERTKMGAII